MTSTSQWYYGRGSEISGPVSDKELFDLAAIGQVLPTDTIWRDAIETGVPAARVKNLFQSGLILPAATPSPTDVAATAVEAAGQSSQDVPMAVAADPEPVAPPFVPPQLAATAQPARPARASAGAGAVILSQDGKNVKYRGKCSTCGREDTSWKSAAIPRGTVRSSFFCTKCRKRRDIEIHGIH
jgi:hypothetical protein